MTSTKKTENEKNNTHYQLVSKTSKEVRHSEPPTGGEESLTNDKTCGKDASLTLSMTLTN